MRLAEYTRRLQWALFVVGLLGCATLFAIAEGPAWLSSSTVVAIMVVAMVALDPRLL